MNPGHPTGPGAYRPKRPAASDSSERAPIGGDRGLMTVPHESSLLVAEQETLAHTPLSPIERAIVSALVSAIVKELREAQRTSRQPPAESLQ